MPSDVFVQNVADSPTAEIDSYRPAGVFISYASEDHDIAKAIYQSIQTLGETIFDRIKIFFDSKSIDVGDEIQLDISKGLNNSDFLFVLYTGVFKRSHGYTGYEVGFFDKLIEDEIAKTGQTTRKIIYLYSDELPPTIAGILGINIGVDSVDLAGSRANYIQKSIPSQDSIDKLARLFLDIADRAEKRLPPPLPEDRDNLDSKRDKRRKALAEEIIPSLRGMLFDSMSTRVTRHSIEQKLIEFQLPKPVSEQPLVSIPDDAKLISHPGAFEIFGVSRVNNSATWSEFSNEVRSRDPLGGSSILLATEQAVISAISPLLRTDSDQILKSYDDTIFRILIARQIEYYNGQKVIHVYFIPKLKESELGNNDTSTILGFINVAAKYRFIFIERDSTLSVESFSLEPDPVMIKNKVRQLVRELLLIEEESRNLKLDQVSAISLYFGGDSARLAVVKSLQGKWLSARQNLMAAAEKMLNTPFNSSEFSSNNSEWLTTLKSFRLTSDEINSTVTVQSLENLKKSFSSRDGAS
jgi:hypothetical protein